MLLVHSKFVVQGLVECSSAVWLAVWQAICLSVAFYLCKSSIFSASPNLKFHRASFETLLWWSGNEPTVAGGGGGRGPFAWPICKTGKRAANRSTDKQLRRHRRRRRPHRLLLLLLFLFCRTSPGLESLSLSLVYCWDSWSKLTSSSACLDLERLRIFRKSAIRVLCVCVSGYVYVCHNISNLLQTFVQLAFVVLSPQLVARKPAVWRWVRPRNFWAPMRCVCRATMGLANNIGLWPWA